MTAFLSPLALLVFPFCLLAAAITDYRRFIIPNELSVALIAGFFLAFLVSGLPYGMALDHLMVAGIALVAGFAAFAFGICGAGDSKLIAAVALWLGTEQILEGLLWIGVSGGVLALTIILLRGAMRWYPGIAALSPRLRALMETEKPYAPYGVAIAAGGLFVFPKTALFLALMG